MCPAIVLRGLSVFFCALMMIPVLQSPARASCEVADFQPFWPAVLNTFIIADTEERIGSIHDPAYTEIILKSAIIKRSRAQALFADLLQDYPVLCQLKQLQLNLQTATLFSTLLFQLEDLDRALAYKQISAQYLSKTALVNPHFTSNLIGHLRFLEDRVHTLEISPEHRRYFYRLANALVKDSNASIKAIQAYSQAFCHMVLLINEGSDASLLDRYSRIISHLGDKQFDDFLLLGYESTAGIEGFLSRAEPANNIMCRWVNSTNDSDGLPICGK